MATEIINLSSFDATFDFTFQPPGQPAVVAANPCQPDGVYIAWLANRAWGYYLFNGDKDVDFTSKSLAQFEQAGVMNDTKRIGQDSMTIRAGAMPKDYAILLREIFNSIRVYVIAPDPSGNIIGVRVYVEPGTVNITKDSEGLSRIEARINFPTVQSQRG